MPLSVTHTLQTAIADDPSFDVSSSEWNADHSMSGTLPIANGGTNATTAAAALTSLGAFPSVGGTLTGNLGITKVGVGVVGPLIALENPGGADLDAAAIEFSDGGALRSRVEFKVTAPTYGGDIIFHTGLSTLTESVRIRCVDGQITAAAVPTLATSLANKQYVDTGHNATAAEYLANTAPTKKLNSGAVWTAATPVTITPAGTTFTPDMNAGFDFIINLASATSTVANPTNGKAGQKGIFYIQQGAGTGRTITSWGSLFYWAGGIKPVLSTAAGSIDIVSYVFSGSAYFCTYSAKFAP